MDGYRDLLGTIDDWFARASDAHPGVVPCARGCAACCHGPFDISVADAALLARAVAALPDEVRARVRERAERQLARMQAFAPAWQAPWNVADLGDERFDALCDEFARVPCPLLGNDGACQVYADRPLVCRLIGLPMGAGDDRVLPNACPIQDDFPAYAALAPQPFDLDAFDDAEEAWLEAGAAEYLGPDGSSDFETTIAAVVVRTGRPSSGARQPRTDPEDEGTISRTT